MGRVFEHGPMRFGIIPPVIKMLMVANITVYLLQHLVGPKFLYIFGLVPYSVFHDLYIWQLFTYLFIHHGFFHILFNLFALWMFGTPVEAQWGPREFLKFYFICGIGAGFINVLLTPGSVIPVIGASGAIYGLLVAFGMLYPDAVVYLYFLFPIKAWHMVMLFALIEFLAGASGGAPTVANFAHLGGMGVGYVYIRYWWSLKIWGKGLWRALTTSRSERPEERSEEKSRKPHARKPAKSEAKVDMDEVDRILDKMLDQGEDSLTADERDTLRRFAKRKPKGHA